mgnify:CR=1 FL=1
MAELVLIDAETLAHAEAMRIVRNTCRAFMTNDPSEISAEDQHEWFTHLDRETTQPYVGFVETVVAAFGLVRNVDGGWWVSGGLLPEFRGHGLGKALFEQLIARVSLKKRSTWLEVLRNNGRAERLYRSLGFVQIYANEDVITMRREFVP